jgi:MoaA/NifB/PqqE/SkfB family radical SAM enzyme
MKERTRVQRVESTPHGERDLSRDHFCIFRLPEGHKRVLWEITDQCNYSCGYCIFSAEHTKMPGELDTKEVFAVLRSLHDLQFSHIKWTGGEPFIRKDIMEILAKTADLGFVFDISTNASLINERIARELKELHCTMFHVSLDGYNERVQTKARGSNTYEPTIRGIKHLVKAGNYVRIGTVIFTGNEDYLAQTVDTVANLGADEIIFSFMEPAGRMKGDRTIISELPIPEAKERISVLEQKYAGRILVNYSFTEEPKECETGMCPAVDRFLYIDNLGKVSPCTWVVERYQEYKTCDTLKTKTLGQLIQSEEIRGYVGKLKSLGSTGCPMRMRS